MNNKKYNIVIPSDANLLYRTLAELHMRGTADDIVQYEAIGSGVVIAVLLCVGMQPDSIATELLPTHILDVGQSDLNLLVRSTIGHKLVECYSIVPSLGELYELCGQKVLNLHVYNATTRKLEVLNYLTCPDMDTTVACSMAYNLGATRCKYDYCGNVYTDASLFHKYLFECSDRKLVCIHTRSSYSIRPESPECYYKCAADRAREHHISAMQVPNMEVVVLDVDSDPYDSSLHSKVAMLTM